MANVTPWEFIVGFLYVLGGLGIFLFGMRVMSEGIQKVAGEGMRRIMATMTQNRFFWPGYRFACHLPGPVFIGHNCNGRKLCKCPITNSHGVDWRNYGSQSWDHPDRVDHCNHW